MSIFWFPCSHNASIAQATTFGYLNPPSKASGIAVALFQKANDDNHQKRVRYNGAILTTNIIDTGLKFENVPDVCIVFISKFDVFNSGYSLYNIDRIVRQTGEVVNYGFEEIYISACIKDGSDVSELMDIFTNDESYNANKYPVTSNIRKRYKQTAEG